MCSLSFKDERELNFGGSQPAGLLRMNYFRCIFQEFCLCSRNIYIKKHLSSVCCWQNCSFHLGCFPHISPFCILPSKITTYRKYAKKCTVWKINCRCKKNSLKTFLQKSGDIYFLVLTSRLKSKFKEKSSKSVWCEQCIFTWNHYL